MDSRGARENLAGGTGEDVVGGVGGAREDVVGEVGNDVARGASGAREVG